MHVLGRTALPGAQPVGLAWAIDRPVFFGSGPVRVRAKEELIDLLSRDDDTQM